MEDTERSISNEINYRRHSWLAQITDSTKAGVVTIEQQDAVIQLNNNKLSIAQHAENHFVTTYPKEYQVKYKMFVEGVLRHSGDSM